MALALGIGASTAIFSVVNAVLLRPMPYPDPGRIVVFVNSGAASPIEFNFWREQATTLQDISAYRFSRTNMTGVDHPEQVRSAWVTSGYFRLFGEKAAMGRTFTVDDERPGGGNVVLLSRAFWRRAFGGDPKTIGKEMALGGKTYKVVGIMGEAVELPAVDAREPVDVWTPFAIAPDSTDQNGYFNVAARLKPGISLSATQGQLRLVTTQFRRKFPNAGLAPQTFFTVAEIRDALAAGEGRYLSVLGGAVAFVLLIACANVANLSLVRATGRKREIAIRSAVGARRGHIVRQLLAESLLLSSAGGVLGLALGSFGIRALLALNTAALPRIGDHGSAVTMDWRVLTFTVLASLITCVLFGLIPALQASRADLGEALKASGARAGAARNQAKARSLLVCGEMALAVTLVTGAGLLIRTLVALRSVDPGFDSHNVLTLKMALDAHRFEKTTAVAELVRNTVQRISALPGVAAASSTCCLPMEDNLLGGVIILGRPLNGRDHGTVDVATISPRYFDTLRIPMVRGRAFTDGDAAGTAPVVIINQAMARRYWQGEDASGAPLQASLEFPDVPTNAWRIVGIAGDTHTYGLSRNAPAIVYFPVSQAPDDFNAYIVRYPVTWIVRTLREPDSLSVAIQKELVQASGGLPASNVRSMDEIVTGSIAGRKFNMLLLAIFGGAALLLAAIGIYGLMAYSVQQRTRELGIRLALGAEAGDVRNMVVVQGLRVALAGVAIGCAAALGLTQIITKFLFGVGPRDPVVFGLVPVLLSAVALVAVWIPARRASRIDPVEALRHE